MSTLEDRLRDAYRAAADTIDPATTPGLAVTAGPQAAPSRRMRFAGQLAPLAAAVAIIIVAIVTTLPVGRPARHHAQTVPRHHARAVKPRPAPVVSPPPFLLVDRGSSLKVYSTRTGTVVATLAAPAGQQFEDVASGGTARTFLAATGLSGSACHAYFYRFELSATGQPSPLTLLRSVPGDQPTAVAAIPGGESYAYSTVHCQTVSSTGVIGISGPDGNRTWAYDEADDYAFSLAATADGGTLALSLFAGSGWADLLLNTHSSAATVDGASRTRPAVPYAQTLAISPSGATLYACISHGQAGELAAYSAATGKLIRVLHRWTLAPASSYFCQVSADVAGKVLLASYSSNLARSTSLIAVNPQAGTAVTLPVKADYSHDGVGAAW